MNGVLGCLSHEIIAVLPRVPLANASRTYFELARLTSLHEWWHWLVLGILLLVTIGFIVITYRRDSRELPLGLRALLVTLRIATFLGLLLFYFQLEKRTEVRLVKNSRIAILFDTSQSMGLPQDPDLPSQGSRLEQIVRTIRQNDLVTELQHKHDVVVYRFDETEQPLELTSLPRLDSDDDNPVASEGQEPRTGLARVLGNLAAGLFVIGSIALVAHFFARQLFSGREGESWALLAAIVLLLSGLIVTAAVDLRYPKLGWLAILGLQSAESNDPNPTNLAANSQTPAADASNLDRNTDWEQELRPQGVKTRLGDAIRYVLNRERGGPFAGVVIMTDGNSNDGVQPQEVIELARSSSVGIYPIGAGSTKVPDSLRIADMEAPRRVYPGDAFQIKTHVLSYGMTGEDVTLRLFVRPAADAGVDSSSDTDSLAVPQGATLLDERRIALGADGQPNTISFETTPSELGKAEYIVRLQPVTKADAPTIEKTARVQIVDRKNRVLLVAGGPTREYRFVRVMCFRDKETDVDVWLQGSLDGAAQEANQVLTEFPPTPEEMFEYDCLIAFDPDWRLLSVEQARLLERWVSEKAGGLILVAGPVYTPEWTTVGRAGANVSLIEGLYPVSFYSRSTGSLARGRDGSVKPWPIDFTTEGRQARQLWLDDRESASEDIWTAFTGVFSYFPIRGVKPAATVLGTFSDPQQRLDGQAPVFFASQFYGAGRVFYIGSGEMWRLRGEDEKYFETFYTKLIRYVSEGRLLRDSNRGVLMANKDRALLGDTIMVTATVTDAQFQPLNQATLQASVLLPNKTRQQVELLPVAAGDSTRDGTYTGQFTVSNDGDYLIEVPVPDSETLEVLTREVQVRVPDREIERTQRNDALLSELATATDGKYFPTIGQAIQPVGGLPSTLVAQNQETYIPGSPDRSFQQDLMKWLMAFICATLSLEWLLRRLNRLA